MKIIINEAIEKIGMYMLISNFYKENHCSVVLEKNSGRTPTL